MEAVLLALHLSPTGHGEEQLLDAESPSCWPSGSGGRKRGGCHEESLEPGLGVDSGDAQHGHVQAALLDWIQLKNERIHPILGTFFIYPKYLYKEFDKCFGISGQM